MRCTPLERKKRECVAQGIKHPLAVMIWSCISWSRTGPLFFVEGTMNQLQYKHVIETVLVPFIDSLDGEDNPRMFMQHGAPCLTAKSVLSAFRDFGIPLLPWPGNSPDRSD